MEDKFKTQFLSQLHYSKKKIIEISLLMENQIITEWAELWQENTALEMPAFPEGVSVYFEGIDPKFGYFPSALRHFDNARNYFASGKLGDSLRALCQANFCLGVFKGMKDEISEASLLNAEKAQIETRKKRRVIFEYYLTRNLQCRPDTEAADEILDSKIIEKTNNKWTAPQYKTLLLYASVIKKILKISDEIAPWVSLQRTNDDAARALCKRHGISPEMTSSVYSGKEFNYFQAFKERQLQYFIYSNISTAASREELFADLKNGLEQLREIYRELK